MTVEELQEQYDSLYAQMRVWHNELTINVICTVVFILTYGASIVFLNWAIANNQTVAPLRFLFIVTLSLFIAGLLTYLSYTYLIEKYQLYYSILLANAKALTSHVVFSQLKNVSHIEFIECDPAFLMKSQIVEFGIDGKPAAYDLEYNHFVDQKTWTKKNANIVDIL